MAGRVRILAKIIFTLSVLASISVNGSELMLSEREIREAAFDWLDGGGSSENEVEVKVYRLSCGSCVEELRQIVAGEREGPRLFMFDSLTRQDQLTVFSLVANALSVPRAEGRAIAFKELLGLFANAPQHYLENPIEWMNLVSSQWRQGSVSMNDDSLTARSFNWLERQNRIIALSGELEWPAAIALSGNLPVEVAASGSPRGRALAQQLSMAWMLKGLSMDQSEDLLRSQILGVDPTIKMDSDGWTQLYEATRGGKILYWRGLQEARVREGFAQWHARLFALPDDRARSRYMDSMLRSGLIRSSRGRASVVELMEASVAKRRLNLSPDYRYEADSYLRHMSLWEFLGLWVD